MVGARQQGTVLISVIVTLVVVAAASYGMNRQLGEMVNRLTAESETAAAQYLAEAGLRHALLAARRSNGTYPSTVSGSLLDQGQYEVKLVQSGPSFEAVSTGTARSGAVASYRRTYTVCTQQTSTMSYAADGKPVTIFEKLGSSPDYLTVENKTSLRARTLIKFDIPITKGSTIISAKLSMTVQENTDTATYNSSVYVDPLTTAFVSDSANWTNYQSGKAWKTPGGDFSLRNEAKTTILANLATYDWEVKGIVNDWVNNSYQNFGVLIRTDAVSTDRYGLKFHKHSISKPTSVWPRLVVTWCS